MFEQVISKPFLHVLCMHSCLYDWLCCDRRALRLVYTILFVVVVVSCSSSCLSLFTSSSTKVDVVMHILFTPLWLYCSFCGFSCVEWLTFNNYELFARRQQTKWIEFQVEFHRHKHLPTPYIRRIQLNLVRIGIYSMWILFGLQLRGIKILNVLQNTWQLEKEATKTSEQTVWCVWSNDKVKQRKHTHTHVCRRSRNRPIDFLRTSPFEFVATLARVLSHPILIRLIEAIIRRFHRASNGWSYYFDSFFSSQSKQKLIFMGDPIDWKYAWRSDFLPLEQKESKMNAKEMSAEIEGWLLCLVSFLSLSITINEENLRLIFNGNTAIDHGPFGIRLVSFSGWI